MMGWGDGASGADDDAAPTIDSLIPAVGPTTGGIQLTLSGQNFVSGTQLIVGGRQATEVSVVSGSLLHAVLPSNPGFLGNASVVVRNPNGKQEAREDLFSYYLGQISFDSARAVFSGNLPVGATADLNGDGKKDLVFLDANNIRLHVLLGDGRGNFSRSQFDVGRRDFTAEALAIADLNSDGKPDIAIANGAPGTAGTSGFRSGGVTIAWNDGQGRFYVTRNIDLGENAVTHAVAVGDFNGDNRADLAVAGRVGISVIFANDKNDFMPPVLLGFGQDLLSVTTGDFNGDGRIDLATAGSNGLKVLLGNGRGGFGPVFDVGLVLPSAAVRVGYAARWLPAMTAADMNSDGHQDLLMPGGYLLLGDGTGNFQPTNLPSGCSSTALQTVVGDFNRDQVPDLAVACGNVSVFLGDGRGGLLPSRQFRVADFAVTLFVNDFNGDQLPDLAIGTVNSSVSLLLADDHGGFPSGGRYYASGQSLSAVITGDWNGDQTPDLAFTNSGSNSVSIFHGSRTGSFSSTAQIMVGSNPRHLAAGDFNGDNLTDLVTVNYGSDNLSLLLGNGIGGFAPAATIPCGPKPLAVTVGDIDGDSHLDLVLVHEANSNLSVLLGNGAGGFSAPMAVLVGSFPRSVVVADWNGDGKQDFVIQLSTRLGVFLGDGLGRFSESFGVSVMAAGAALTVSDLNRDGFLDITAGCNVFLGDKQNGLRDGFKLPCGFAPYDYYVVVADVDLDQNPDLVVSESGVKVYQGDGEGHFASPIGFAITRPTRFAMGDWDGDGKVDLAVLSADSGFSTVINNAL